MFQWESILEFLILSTEKNENVETNIGYRYHKWKTSHNGRLTKKHFYFRTFQTKALVASSVARSARPPSLGWKKTTQCRFFLCGAPCGTKDTCFTLIWQGNEAPVISVNLKPRGSDVRRTAHVTVREAKYKYFVNVLKYIFLSGICFLFLTTIHICTQILYNHYITTTLLYKYFRLLYICFWKTLILCRVVQSISLMYFFLITVVIACK